ncbi:MAG: PQQ-binding-like beta-propeller repeat protein [Phycisphaerales bacterium]|jgi:outer membrane protein assembly factor BamB|nr:PQQ-binding-like beta-propeller repeat protein [Phycisphaerales bacterium]MBT7170453.1 PQQ-binding-like beta-propeller repeat protein [Phycisphaerales bacterium]
MRGFRYSLIPLSAVLVGGFVLAILAWPLASAEVRGRYPQWVAGLYSPDGQPVTIRDAERSKAPPEPVVEVDPEGELKVFSTLAEDAPEFDGMWPNFRGFNFDGVNDEWVPLLDRLDTPPPVVWTIPLGQGYAGPAVYNSRLYVIDYDNATKRNLLRCFSFADGKELWQRSFRRVIKTPHGYSRTIPSVNDDVVVAITPNCAVMACDPVTGKWLWGVDLVATYGTTVPKWCAGQCPLLDMDRVVLAPGGTKLMVCLDALTGKEIWTTPNDLGWKMTHSSIYPMSFAGKSLYVYVASRGVVGVNAETGEIEFSYDGWRIRTAAIPTPVELGDGKLLLTGGYGAGGQIIRLIERDDRIEVKRIKTYTPEEFGCYQQTPVRTEDLVFTVLPKVGMVSCQLACMETSGELLWRSGPDWTFGWGPWMVADGKILLLDDDGRLSMVKLSSEGFVPLGRVQLKALKHESWAPLALVEGRLVLRDLTTMICVDLRKNGETHGEE